MYTLSASVSVYLSLASVHKGFRFLSTPLQQLSFYVSFHRKT